MLPRPMLFCCSATGAVAQLVERDIRIVEARGSNPLSSTSPFLLEDSVAPTTRRRTATTVATYIAALPADQARSLRRLRDTILATAPGGVTEVSYGVPGIRFPNGGRVHFGSRRGGLSLYAGHVSALFAHELTGFTIAGTTIHFTPDHELPIALIKRITRAVLARADERAATAKKRR